MTTTRTKSKRARNARSAADVGRARVATAAPSRRSRRSGHAPRQLIVTTCLAFLVAVGLLAWDLTDSWRNAPPSVNGQIAMPNAGGINLVDPASGRSQPLVKGEANASVTAVAWSADHATL